MENENWKEIPGHEGRYEVSDKGRVKSLDRTITRSDGVRRKIKGRILKPYTDRDGYMRVRLCRGGEKKSHAVHRLVLAAFIGPCPDGFEACHNDGDPANNRPDNLRWDTRSGNALDRAKHGTCHNTAKTHCKYGHEFYPENLVPSALKKGWRKCIICSRADSYICDHEIPKDMHWAVYDMALEKFLLEKEGV